jgi:hypothetical protein
VKQICPPRARMTRPVPDAPADHKMQFRVGLASQKAAGRPTFASPSASSAGRLRCDREQADDMHPLLTHRRQQGTAPAARASTRRTLIHSDTTMDTMVPRWAPRAAGDGRNLKSWSKQFCIAPRSRLILSVAIKVYPKSWSRSSSSSILSSSHRQRCALQSIINAGGRHG